MKTVAIELQPNYVRVRAGIEITAPGCAQITVHLEVNRRRILAHSRWEEVYCTAGIGALEAHREICAFAGTGLDGWKLFWSQDSALEPIQTLMKIAEEFIRGVNCIPVWGK